MTEEVNSSVWENSGIQSIMSDVVLGFSGERLRYLIETAGLTVQNVSDGSGVSTAGVNQYVSGRARPRYEQMLKLCDFFGVSLDYLAGRTSDEETDAVERLFPDRFMFMRKLGYERWLIQGRGRIDLLHSKGIEAPYPYNLLDAVVDPHGKDYWDVPLSEDQNAGLCTVLESLTEREQRALHLYFAENKTLAETGKEFGITRERVRQILAKAIRRMRHPRNMNLIRYGLRGYAERLRLKNLWKELERTEEQLDEYEESLVRRRTVLEQLEEGLNGVSSSKIRGGIYNADIETLDLSVRSFNCLKRANCDTVRDVCELAKSGDMVKVRNLGRRSMQEILLKLREKVGEDYRAVYSVGYE